MHTPAGIAFGNYFLLQRLAHGGMAEVFLAQQSGPEGFQRRVAIKRILPHLIDSEDFLRMFLEEARVAASLTHPNVAHIYELGQVDDHYFIAMEYIDGIHAGALIERGVQQKIPPALVARIGADACAGLNYVHNADDPNTGEPLQLVHRDISPPNLMISYDGVVKLMDFGIAKAVGKVDHTRPGVVKGKFAYMSPEQTVGETLDGRSDVFSLALVMWELLAGQVALPRTDPIEAMTMIRDGRMPSLLSVRPDVPKKLVGVVEHGLQVEREHRPSAAELGNALEGFIKSSPELGTSMQLSEWVRRGFPRPTTGGELLGPATSTTAMAEPTAINPSVAADSVSASFRTPDLPLQPTLAADLGPETDAPPTTPSISSLEIISGDIHAADVVPMLDEDDDDGPTVVTLPPQHMDEERITTQMPMRPIRSVASLPQPPHAQPQRGLRIAVAAIAMLILIALGLWLASGLLASPEDWRPGLDSTDQPRDGAGKNHAGAQETAGAR